MSFLYQSPQAQSVRGVILDSPMLDFSRTMDLGARQRGIPGPLTLLGKAVAGFRFGIDWEALNYLKRAEDLDTPILLFHSDEDETVPIETSDALAKARPDIVTYVRVAGAPHTQVWNVGPAAYEAAIRDFLREVTR